MNNYRIISDIGSGAYSTVQKAINLQTGQVVAIKLISQQNLTLTHLISREIHLLKECSSHPNIIKLLDNFYNEQLKLTYLVFQYLPMDLITFYKSYQNDKKRTLYDEQICYIIYQIVNGVRFMHQKRIMHRDIKPENILIDPVTLKVKLIDFGFAKYHQINIANSNNNINTDYMVTRWYRPLEIVLGLPYDFKVDVFSVGAVMLELYLGREIFRSKSNIDQFYWIVRVCGFPQNWIRGKEAIRKLGLDIQLKNCPQLTLSKKLISATLTSIKKLAQLTKDLPSSAAFLTDRMLKTSPQQRASIQEVYNHSYFAIYKIRNNLLNSLQNVTKINKVIDNQKEHNLLMNNRNRAYSMDTLSLGMKLLGVDDKKDVKDDKRDVGLDRNCSYLSEQFNIMNYQEHQNLHENQIKKNDKIELNEKDHSHFNLHLHKLKQYPRNQIRSLNQGIKVISLKKIKVIRNINDQRSKQKQKSFNEESMSNQSIVSQNSTKNNNHYFPIKLNQQQKKDNLNNISKKLNKPMFLRIKQRINEGMNHGQKIKKELQQISKDKINAPIKLKPKKLDCLDEIQMFTLKSTQLKQLEEEPSTSYSYNIKSKN